jgi:hypothetical protein
MARLDASWLAGFLTVLCAFLWLIGGTLPSRRFWFSQRVERLSPMDMPDWYRIPLASGAHYESSGPTIVEHQWIKQKQLAVRGFW